MPTRIADITPSWLKPENASVLDSPLRTVIRALVNANPVPDAWEPYLPNPNPLAVLRDPQSQVLGLMTTQVPSAPAHTLGEIVRRVAQKTEMPSSPKRVPTLYHSSPGTYQAGKLPFTAYYGDRDFVKAFPDEFGDKLYALRLKPNARVLDLTDDAAQPLVNEMARRQWGSDVANLTRDDIYELWTDKALVSDAAHALGLEVDALKYGAEYIVPSRTIATSRTRTVKGGQR